MTSFIPDEPQDRRRLLRQLEITSHVTTAAAFALTIVLVTTATAQELNLVADLLFGTIGWAATGVAAITAITLFYTLYNRFVDEYPRLILSGGVVIAFLGVFDLAANLLLFGRVGFPDTVHWAEYGPAVATVLLAGTAAIYRHWIVPRASRVYRRHERGVKATAFALLVATSLVALPFMGGVSPDGHDGIASADHDWDYTGTSHDILSEDDSGNGIYQDSDGNWWMVGQTNDSVFKYDSSWSYTGTSHDVSTEAGTPQDIHKGDDGKWYVLDAIDAQVYVYDSDWSYTGTSYDVSTEDDAYPRGIYQDSDGNWWMVGDGTGSVFKYDSSWSYTGTSHDVSTEDTAPKDIREGADGWWVVGESNDNVYHYSSSWSYSGTSHDVSTEDTAPQGIAKADGGNWWIVGNSDDNVYEYGGHPATDPVKGQVVDSDGDPVQNATVYATGYDAANPPTIDGTPFDEIANDPLPDGWDAQTDTDWADRGQIDVEEAQFQEKRVLMHENDKWNIAGGWPDVTLWNKELNPTPDLAPTPSTVSPEDDVIFSCWSPKTDLLEDEFDASVPGMKSTSCDITIQRVDPTGDVQHEKTVSTRPAVKVTAFGNLGSKEHHAYYAGDMSTGIYHVYPDDSPEAGIYYAVAPDGQVTQLESEIENWASSRSDAISQYNQEIKNEYDAGNLDLVSAKTNSTGHYSLDVPNQATKAELRVIKDGGENAASAGDLTRTDLRNEYDSTVRNNFNDASAVNFEEANEETFVDVCRRMDPIADEVGVPFQGSGQTDVPNENADIQGEYLIPEDLNPQVRKCAALNIVESILDGELGWLSPGLADDLASMTDAELEDLLATVNEVLKTNDALCQEFADSIGATSCEDAIEDPETLDRTQLETRVSEGYDTIDDSSDHLGGGGGGVTGTGGGSVDVGDGTVTVGDETFSTEWNVGSVSDWDDAALMVRLTWSNGTTTVLNESSEYVSVEEEMLGSDTVKLTEYPVGSEDPAAVQARLDVVTTDSTGSGDTGPVKNPTWNGDLPSLNSVKVSKWEPGEQDSFTVGVDEGDTDRFGQLKRVEVTNPAGTTTTYDTVENGEITAYTNSSGDHRVAVVFTAADDNATEFTEVVQVRAGSTSKGRPPSIRGQSGAIGRYAVVGHGLDAGEVDVERGGSQVTMTGVLPQDADVPQTLTADTTGLSVATDATTTVRLRRGATRQTVRNRINVVLYADEIDDGALVWRNGNALTREGTQWGDVTVKNGTTVDTISDETATVEIRVNGDPSIVDRVRHWVDANVNLSIPGLPGAIGFDIAPFLAALVALRRRDPPEPPTPDLPADTRQPNPQEV